MRRLLTAAAAALVCLAAVPVQAHFGMVIPSDNMVMAEDPRTIQVVLSFSHPFERVGMELVRPERFEVVAEGRRTDLTGALAAAEVMGSRAWRVDYPVRRPGLHVFYMQPQPYWEPAEDCFIIHYTKTVVAAFGQDDGWDAAIGLKTEIVPVSKPFGLYAGNVFQGIVTLDGRPVPWAEVEVEYDNRDGRATAPADYMITQTVKADANGVFTYAAPRAGWWGFAALSEADFTLVHDGEPKAVELGAVLWVRFEQWRE
jgi:cobalt/nickel transport protein